MMKYQIIKLKFTMRIRIDNRDYKCHNMNQLCQISKKIKFKVLKLVQNNPV